MQKCISTRYLTPVSSNLRISQSSHSDYCVILSFPLFKWILLCLSCSSFILYINRHRNTYLEPWALHPNVTTSQWLGFGLETKINWNLDNTPFREGTNMFIYEKDSHHCQVIKAQTEESCCPPLITIIHSFP